jgi:hypothetical protein
MFGAEIPARLCRQLCALKSLNQITRSNGWHFCWGEGFLVWECIFLRLSHLLSSALIWRTCGSYEAKSFRVVRTLESRRESWGAKYGSRSLTFGSELLLPAGLQRTPSARVPGVFSYPRPRKDFRRFLPPPFDSLVRYETRGAVPKCHISPRCPFQTDQNSLTLWFTPPSRLTGLFGKGCRSKQVVSV